MRYTSRMSNNLNLNLSLNPPPGPGTRPPLDELAALRDGPHAFLLKIARAYGPILRYPVGPPIGPGLRVLPGQRPRGGQARAAGQRQELQQGHLPVQPAEQHHRPRAADQRRRLLAAAAAAGAAGVPPAAHRRLRPADDRLRRSDAGALGCGSGGRQAARRRRGDDAHRAPDRRQGVVQRRDRRRRGCAGAGDADRARSHRRPGAHVRDRARVAADAGQPAATGGRCGRWRGRSMPRSRSGAPIPRHPPGDPSPRRGGVGGDPPDLLCAC